MKPKSHKNFIKTTAEELDCNELLVEDCTGFFFSKARKALTDMVHSKICLSNLGTFTIKSKELAKLHQKYEAHLNLLNNPESFNQMAIKKEIEQKYIKVCKVSKILELEKIRKNQIKTNRNDFITNQNLEK